ncbi:hypothetical protein SKAU_G00196300 [Synaphobranchus kaupii]|uniref:Reverse transcriptase n=1 Tax=Synaphobranchus kaupii TaxID=118154 RepID=A0A9Q1FEI9_SYNKA|nr:hypothetical protein SKAU_G00196300 [Synaphobranchus kaupii]
MQLKLLAQEDLTFKKAYELALSMELAAKNTREISGRGHGTQQIHVVNEAKTFPRRGKGQFKKQFPKYEKTGQKQDSVGQQPCYRCIGCSGKHSARDCWFKNEKCHVCSKVGHIARACRNRRPVAQAQYVEREQVEDESELLGVYTVYTTSNGKKGITMDVTLDGREVNMHVDTGAAVSLLSEVCYRKSQSQLPLKETKLQLTTYSGQTIPLLGYVQVAVQYEEQKANLPLVVVKGDRPALLGRNWLEKIKLNWQSIFSVEKVTDTDAAVKEVLQRHPVVFAEGANVIKDFKVTIRTSPSVDADSEQYLTINTHRGLYRYHRLSYGVSSAPSIFQSIMDQILQGLEYVTCFLDDILITASSKEEHLWRLDEVLTCLEKYNPTAALAQPAKAKRSVELDQLECDAAFEKAKQLLLQSNVLVHYDTNSPLKLACDASAYGVCAVISHIMDNGEEQPIVFASRTLSQAEKNYAQIEKEALAIIYGVKKFHKYLYGRRFTLITDHKPLLAILGPKSVVPALAAMRMQRWALILMAYNYSIEYRRSTDHLNADALSRLPQREEDRTAEEAKIFYFSVVPELPVCAKDIEQTTRNDPLLSKVWSYTVNGWPNYVSEEALTPYFTRRHELFADQAYGLPEECVSDNGPQLTSSEFGTFMKQNGIKHTLVPAFHPASNGAAERSVQILKRALLKPVLEEKGKSPISLKHRLANFLLRRATTSKFETSEVARRNGRRPLSSSDGGQSPTSFKMDRENGACGPHVALEGRNTGDLTRGGRAANPGGKANSPVGEPCS